MKLMKIDAAIEIPSGQLEEATAWRPISRPLKRRDRRRVARARAVLRNWDALGLDVRDLDAVLAAAAAK